MNAVDPLVADYLERLDRAAAALPADRRAELVLEIRDHITAAQAAGATGDADLREVLVRLGSPDEIAEAASDDRPPAAPGAYRRPGTGTELAAVLLLTLGSLFPVAGWLAGAVLLWTSRRWRVREKLLGTLVVPFGPGGLLVLAPLLYARTETCASGPVPVGAADGLIVQETVTCTTTGGGPPWLFPWAALAAGVASVVLAVLLYRTARRRADAEAPVAGGAPGASPWGSLEVGGVLTLGIGGLLAPFVGPLVGFVLVCCSARWTTREKVVAGALAVLPLLLALTGLLVVRSSG